MRDTDFAASFAIFTAKRLGMKEVTPDHLLLGCLRAISRFGVANIGPWAIDLEALGVDWVRQLETAPPKVAYSHATVALFDRAAQIAKSGGDTNLNVCHLLAAFAAEERGLMADLMGAYGITNASWRAAVARLGEDETMRSAKQERTESEKKATDYLTPEEAAKELGVHVQTMRAYVRSGRLPAFRLAGERAIRILRTDLNKVLEPLETEK